MASTSPGALLDIHGPAAPPRSNGELVFAAPWESRAFGLALALHAGGKFEWEDFRQELIRAIGQWEREHDEDEEWSYYRCWLIALERTLDRQGLIGHSEVEARTIEFAARPHGHDHRHDHDHDHEPAGDRPGHDC